MPDIKKILKEATKDLLSEESLEQIEQAFTASVEHHANLHVEKALLEQDEEYANRLSQLLEAIDADHTKKLNRVVEALDRDRYKKLRAVVERYEKELDGNVIQVKEAVVGNLSDYLDLYLEKTFPPSMIEEAVHNKQATRVLESLRKMLGVDKALASESVRDAIRDGKIQIVEAKKAAAAASKAVIAEKKAREIAEASLMLEQKTRHLDKIKRSHVMKVLGDKDPAFINENFEYVLEMYEKDSLKKSRRLLEEARKTTRSDKTSAPVLKESVQPARKRQEKPTRAPIQNAYMQELSRY